MRYVVTDNGSNAVKAFREDYFKQLVDNDMMEEEETMEEAHMDNNVVDEMVSNYTFDFDICDRDLDNQFQQVDAISNMGKRLSCYSHMIQLVVTSFNEHKHIQPLLKDVQKLVKKVNTSTVAIQKLTR